MRAPPEPTWESLLLEAGLVGPDGVAAARKLRKDRGLRPLRALVDSGAIDEAELLRFVSNRTKIDTCDPSAAPIPQAVASRVPRELAVELDVVPFTQKKTPKGLTLVVAALGPLTKDAVTRLEAAAKMPVHCVLASMSSIESALELVYGPGAESLDPIDFGIEEDVPITDDEDDDGLPPLVSGVEDEGPHDASDSLAGASLDGPTEDLLPTEDLPTPPKPPPGAALHARRLEPVVLAAAADTNETRSTDKRAAIAVVLGDTRRRASLSPPAHGLAEPDFDEGLSALWLGSSLDDEDLDLHAAERDNGELLVVLEEVTAASTASIERFARFLAPSPRPALLARVPLVMLPMFRLDRPVRGGVLSVWLHGSCDSCGKTSGAELDRVRVEQLVENGTLVLACRSCEGPLAICLTPQIEAAVERIPWMVMSARVAPYLYPVESGRMSVPPPRPRSPVPDPADTAAGARFGDYHVIKPLARGGMGEILLARKIGLERFQKKVVLKVLLPEHAGDQLRLDMFLEEARLVAHLAHPNVVQTFDLGKVGDRYFIAMEYVEGYDLVSVLRRCIETHRVLPIEIACWIVSEVCAALHAAHTHKDELGKSTPIIHRDVAPDNVLLSTQGIVKLADFGVATMVGSVTGPREPVMVGKLSYLPPERLAQPDLPLDGRHDVYAAGVVLFECLALRSMFRRATEEETLRAILHEPPPSICALRPEAPPELDAILARATAKDPAQRYASARYLGLDLLAVVGRMGSSIASAHAAELLEELFAEPAVSAG